MNREYAERELRGDELQDLEAGVAMYRAFTRALDARESWLGRARVRVAMRAFYQLGSVDALPWPVNVVAKIVFARAFAVAAPPEVLAEIKDAVEQLDGGS